jgi:hypothetical protein
MTRDILTLRNGENIVVEFLSQNRYRVMGNNAHIRYSGPVINGNIHSVSFPEGPRFSRGYESNFRGEDRKVNYIELESVTGDTSSVILNFA